MRFECLTGNAGIAQLVEHNLAKVGVAGSSPVSRSGRAEGRNGGRAERQLGVQQSPSNRLGLVGPLESADEFNRRGVEQSGSSPGS